MCIGHIVPLQQSDCSASRQSATRIGTANKTMIAQATQMRRMSSTVPAHCPISQIQRKRGLAGQVPPHHRGSRIIAPITIYSTTLTGRQPVAAFLPIPPQSFLGRLCENPRPKLGKLAVKFHRRLNWRHLVNLQQPSIGRQMENENRLTSPDALQRSSNQPGCAATTVKNRRGRTIRMS